MTQINFPPPCYNHYENNIAKWYENYVHSLEKKISKTAFAKMLGYESFTELRKLYNHFDNEKIADFVKLKKQIKSTNDNALLLAFNDYFFSLQKNKTLSNALEYLAIKGSLSKADIDEFATNRYSSFSVSLKNAIREIVAKKDLIKSYELSLFESDQGLLANHFMRHCDSALYSKIITSQQTLYMVDDDDFAIVYDNYLKMIGSKAYVIDYDFAQLIFKRATEDNLANYEQVADIIRKKEAEKGRMFYFDNAVSSIAKAEDDISILIETANWLGNEEIAQDKVCFDFFMEHCNPDKLSLKSKRQSLWHDPWHNVKSSSHTDISKILTSKSMIAPPVLASYLLYNIGSTEFSIERFYAILYVIQKLPVLRPFVERLEPIHRIETTRRYDRSDLNNSLSATFLLIDKLKHINSHSSNNVEGYFDFVHELFAAKQYPLVIGEAVRMIEIAGLSGTTRLDNVIYHAVNEVDEEVLKGMPVNCLHAAYMLLTRSTGSKVEKLAPFIEDEYLEVYDKLEDEDLRHALTRPQTGRLEKHQEVRRFLKESLNIEKSYDVLSDASQLEGLLRASTLDDTIITFEEKKFEYKGHDPSYFMAYRREYQFLDRSTENKEHTPFGKLIENLGFFRYLRKDDMGMACYLNAEMIRGKKWLFEKERFTYAFKEGRLIVSATINLHILFNLIIELKPSSIEMVSLKYFSGEGYRYDYHQDNCDVEVSVMKISNMTERFFNAFTLHYEFLDNAELWRFSNYNPLQSEIKKHLPRFYFYGKTLNEDGIEY